MFGILVLAGMPEGLLMMGVLMTGSLMMEVFVVSKPGKSIGFVLSFAIVPAVNAVSVLYTAVFILELFTIGEV
jgi:hypothetical protein